MSMAVEKQLQAINNRQFNNKMPHIISNTENMMEKKKQNTNSTPLSHKDGFSRATLEGIKDH